MNLTRQIVLVALLVVNNPITRADQLNIPAQKLLPTSLRANLWFGNVVDINGEYVVASGPTSGNRGGMATLYTHANASWEHVTDLNSPSILDSSYFYFGRSATVSAGNSQAPTRVLVSSDGGGRIFEESNGNWIETALLPGFGAIQGNTAVSSVSGPEAVVSTFENGVWTPGDMLIPHYPDGSGLGGGFGEHILLEGDTVLISASTQDFNSTTINSGAVFTYKQSNDAWISTETLQPSDPIWRGKFGSDIDLVDNTLIAGRPAGGPAANGPYQGIAYIYEKIAGDWIETERIMASEGYLDDGFGSEVALSQNYAAVSTRGANGEGRVYLFNRSNDDWTELGWLATGLPFNTDQFGVSIAMEGNQLVVGARLDDERAENAGAVYVYTIPEPATFHTIAAFLIMAFSLQRRVCTSLE